MPTLTWTGKDAVVNHHLDVPFRLLKDHPELSCGDPDSGNIVMEGDNLEGLKALLPYYAGRVKCICIDPPYNTGNEGWVYNDNVNSPEIKDWLGKVVGKEAEDLNRHAKWLCMMYPRLKLLKDFLREDGAIFVCIDDYEADHLKLIMDEIFGRSNHVATFIQKRRDTPDNRNTDRVSLDHEYVICYKSSDKFKVLGQPKDLEKYTNKDNDPKGPWMSDNLTGLAGPLERPNLHYDVVNPETGISYPPHPRRGWAIAKDTMARNIAEGRILWPTKNTGRPRLKRFRDELSTDRTNFPTILKTPGNVQGTKELGAIFGDKVFAFPKPVELIRTLIEQSTYKDSLVLDSFGGSGTTAHAVLKQNAADGGTRKFITIEMLPEVATKVTSTRIRKSIEGYINDKDIEVPGLGGGFRYVSLGQTLFDASGQIRNTVTFGDLARHVWFTETGSPLPKGKVPNSPLLGNWKGTAIYLLYNGILGDETAKGGNMLTRQILASLPKHEGSKIIYAAGTKVSEDLLARYQADFKQTPYKIRTR